MKFKIFIYLLPFLIQSCESNNSKSIEKGASKNSKVIYEKDYGEHWPFTVDKGLLKCEMSAVFFIVEGKTYTINGIANGYIGKKGYYDVRDIWLDDTIAINNLVANGVPKDMAKSKISIAPIINDGLKLCNEN